MDKLIRGIDESLMMALKKLADSHHRSLNAEILVALEAYASGEGKRKHMASEDESRAKAKARWEAANPGKNYDTDFKPWEFDRSIFRKEFIDNVKRFDEDAIADYRHVDAPAVPTWTVTITDTQGKHHSFEVQAESKREAERNAFDMSGLKYMSGIIAQKKIGNISRATGRKAKDRIMYEIQFEIVVGGKTIKDVLQIEADGEERAIEFARHVLEERYGDENGVLLECQVVA